MLRKSLRTRWHVAEIYCGTGMQLLLVLDVDFFSFRNMRREPSGGDDDPCCCHEGNFQNHKLQIRSVKVHDGVCNVDSRWS